MIWLVPVTIVECGRYAVVEAQSKRAAIAKVRSEDWHELTDVESSKVTIARGRVIRPLDDDDDLEISKQGESR